MLIPLRDENPRVIIPKVTYAIVALNVAVFLLQMGMGTDPKSDREFTLSYGLIPAAATGATSEEIVGAWEAHLSEELNANVHSPFITIITSMFMHGGLFHFAGNMAFLWVFGDNIEHRLGHFKYLLFYLVSGVIATLSHFAIDSDSQAPLVGASGAIAGVMGAYLLLYPFNRIKALVIFYFITVIELRAMVFLGIWFFLQIINSLGFLGLSAGANVAFMAHVGGFIAGVVLIAFFKIAIKEPIIPSRPPRNYWD